MSQKQAKNAVLYHDYTYLKVYGQQKEDLKKC